MLRTIWGKVRRHASGAPPTWTIELHRDGFSVIPTYRFAERVDIDWASVREVVAYKVDCYVHDAIYMSIQIGDDEYITLSEDHAGYAEWIQAAQKHLPGMRQDWYEEVAFPPFARNETVLFRR